MAANSKTQMGKIKKYFKTAEFCNVKPGDTYGNHSA
jgi:hypothetical protein